MEKTKIRTYRLDGDSLEVTFHLDELSGKYLGDYPNFEENPRYTPNGRKWTDTITDDCPYADGKDRTCGACSFLKCQDEKDIIGICMNEKLRINGGELK